MTTTPKTRTLRIAASSLFALMLLLTAAFPAAAQHQHGQRAMQQADTTRGMMGMMQGGMMGMMQQHMQMMEQGMQDPLHRSAMLVHVLPTLQEPLALSDDQVARLQQRTEQFGQQRQAHRQQMMEAREQLQEVLATEDAAPDRVRSLLEEAALHRARMQALAYETAAEMRAVLSAEQLNRLSRMPPMQMHQHVMANMTMMDMVKMMQDVHGDMMQGGMEGMMQGGMKQQR